MFRRFVLRTAAALTLLVTLSAPAAAQGPAADAAARQFSIMIWETPQQLALRTDPVQGAAYWNAFAAYGAELQQAGILRGGTALQTGSTVRSVTVRNGARRVTPSGVRPAGNELGGYFIIEVPTVDDAIRWAGKLPSAVTGTVEVRQAYPAPTMMK